MRFKIVLVPFPFDDLSQTKVRPAVCLTEKTGLHEHIIVAFITSRQPADILPSDIELLADTDTGLKMKSFLRLRKMTTMPNSFIERELGNVTKDKQVEIYNRLKELFNIQA